MMFIFIAARVANSDRGPMGCISRKSRWSKPTGVYLVQSIWSTRFRTTAAARRPANRWGIKSSRAFRWPWLASSTAQLVLLRCSTAAKNAQGPGAPTPSWCRIRSRTYYDNIESYHTCFYHAWITGQRSCLLDLGIREYHLTSSTRFCVCFFPRLFIHFYLFVSCRCHSSAVPLTDQSSLLVIVQAELECFDCGWHLRSVPST